MRVIGIDPGYDRMGLAIVEKTNGKEILLYSDCLNTDARETVPERIVALGQKLQKIVLKWRPAHLAIEKIFFTTNQKTATGVAESKGMAEFICGNSGLSIFEYTPLEIKTAICGYGKADKRQVKEMTKKLIKFNKKGVVRDDEYDAVAVALTHLATPKNLSARISSNIVAK